MSRKVCKSCGLASYCSRECQVKHWPKHKEECKVYKIPLELREKAKKWAQSGISDEFEQFIDNALMKTPTASKVRLMKFSMKKKENNVLFYSAYDENLFIKIAYCPPEKDSTYKIIPVDKIRAYAEKSFCHGKKVCIIITLVNEEFYTINIQFADEYPKNDKYSVTMTRFM